MSSHSMGNFLVSGNGTVQYNISGERGCSIPAADWLDSSDVAIAQLAHLSDEIFLFFGDTAFSEVTLISFDCVYFVNLCFSVSGK